MVRNQPQFMLVQEALRPQNKQKSNKFLGYLVLQTIHFSQRKNMKTKQVGTIKLQDPEGY